MALGVHVFNIDIRPQKFGPWTLREGIPLGYVEIMRSNFSRKQETKAATGGSSQERALHKPHMSHSLKTPSRAIILDYGSHVPHIFSHDPV